MTKYIKIPKDNYGYIGLSKYTAQYRHEYNDTESLTEYKNVATIKLVPKSSMIGSKAKGEARYITLPSITNLANSSHSKDNNSKTQPLDSSHHSEQALNAAINNSYKGINKNDYWIKSIYSERIPCSSETHLKRTNTCKQLIGKLESNQLGANGPPITVYYSVEAQEHIDNKTIEQVKGYPLASSQNQEQDLRQDILRDIQLGKSMEGGESLEVDFNQIPTNLSEKDTKRVFNHYNFDIVMLSSSLPAYQARYKNQNDNVLKVMANNLSKAMEQYIQLAEKLSMPGRFLKSYIGINAELKENINNISGEIYEEYHKLMREIDEQIIKYNNFFNEKVNFAATEIKELRKSLYSTSIQNTVGTAAADKLREVVNQLDELLANMRREAWLYNKEVKVANENISKTDWLKAEFVNLDKKFASHLEKYKEICGNNFKNNLKDIDSKFAFDIPAVETVSKELSSSSTNLPNESSSSTKKRTQECQIESETKKQKNESRFNIPTPPPSALHGIVTKNSSTENLESNTSFSNNLK